MLQHLGVITRADWTPGLRTQDREELPSSTSSVEFEQRKVAADHAVRVTLPGQLQESLIVRIAATRQWWIGWVAVHLDPLAQRVLGCHQCSLSGEFKAEGRVGQHALPLGMAIGAQQNAGLAALDSGAQQGAAGVGEHQQVQPDVGVEYESNGWTGWRVHARESCTSGRSPAEILCKNTPSHCGRLGTLTPAPCQADVVLAAPGFLVEHARRAPPRIPGVPLDSASGMSHAN